MDWKLFATAFWLLFIAELGDKTQLAVFSLVCQHRSPLPIFLGATLALTLVTFIGALFGQVVSKYVPMQYVQLVAGLLFLGMGIYILWQSITSIVA